MDNHIMYFCDKFGELELTRCSLCKQMVIHKGEMKCHFGYDCERPECDKYVPINSDETSYRLQNIRNMNRWQN